MRFIFLCQFAVLTLLSVTSCVSYQSKPLDLARDATAFRSRSLGAWSKGGEMNLRQLTEAAFHFHPSLVEAKAEIAAAEAAMITASQRPNPSASFSPEYNFSKGASTPWIWGLAVDVPVELGGKRAARVLKAYSEANAARCKLAAAAQKVRAEVRAALVETASAEARVALLEEQRHIQEDLVKLLKERVDAGDMSRTELTTYQLALNRAALDVSAARRDAGKSRATLAMAVGVPVSAFNGVKVKLDFGNVEVVGGSALKTHPDVMLALADYATAEAVLKGEIAKQYPDLKLTSGFQWDQDDRKWQLPGLGIDLPVLHRNQGGIAEAKARRDAAATRLTRAQARIIGEIDAARAALQGAQDQAREAEKLLASERDAESQAEKNLKAGGGDRLELLTAKVQGAAGRVSLLEAQALVQQAAAALEAASQPSTVIESFMKEHTKP